MRAGCGHRPRNCSRTPSSGGRGAHMPRCIFGRPRLRRSRLLKRCCMTSKLPERLRLDRLATPIGEALIVTDEAGYLRAFDWADCEASMARLLRLHYGSLTPLPGAAPKAMMRLLRRYFDGDT